MIFSSRLKELLSLKGETWKQVSEKLSIGKNQQKNWETKDSAPDGKTLLKLAEYFNVSTDYLLGNETRLFNLSPQEEKIIKLFRDATEDNKLQMIYVLMNVVNKDSNSQIVYRAARSSDNAEHHIEHRTPSEIEKLENAPKITNEKDL